MNKLNQPRGKIFEKKNKTKQRKRQKGKIKTIKKGRKFPLVGIEPQTFNISYCTTTPSI